jgi:ribokinase
MIAAVGSDDHGEHGVASLEAEGIDVTRIRRTDGDPTGVALIVVGPRGENQIAVAPGANSSLELDADDRALIGEAEVILTNNEIPQATVVDALRAAHDGGTLAILNPAPAHALSAEMLSLGPILTPNEHELVVAIGNDETGPALDELAIRNHGPVIVTQGPAGALLADRDRRQRFSGYPAPSPVDTTGAGDTFCGVLAAWLADGRALPDAITAANAAGALSVGAAGARAGMPGREEIEALLEPS